MAINHLELFHLCGAALWSAGGGWVRQSGHTPFCTHTVCEGRHIAALQPESKTHILGPRKLEYLMNNNILACRGSTALTHTAITIY